MGTILRRSFLTNTAAGIAAVMATGKSLFGSAQHDSKPQPGAPATTPPGASHSEKVPLTFACGLYDRMVALYTGDARPEGIDLKFLVNDSPRDIFA